MNFHSIIEEILDLFAARGGEEYFGEPVSQLEHALQTALQAEREGATDALVVAALLHDLGHLIHQLPEDIADRGMDARHEMVGAAWLAAHFPPAVTEPVRLHVAAKRYLCAVDEDYRSRLSPASQHSLALQGGPFSREQAQTFIALPYAAEALRLRRWDELAKEVGASTPGLESYRTNLERVLKTPF